LSDIYYVYPMFKNMSFSLIAEQHIRYLERKVKVQKIPEDVLDNLMWIKPRNILLHPILYMTMGERKEMLEDRRKRLRNIQKVAGVIGGFETADSDKISKEAVKILNQLNVIFMPSKFAVDCYKNSGVEIPIHIIPHGLGPSMLTTNKDITHTPIKSIANIKKRDDLVLVLYFVTHSEYRKGADIVADAMSFIQEKHKDVILVVKSGSLPSRFNTLKTMLVPFWLNDDQLRQLYDVCDMLLVPSRGGGFELNALEGIARGLPTLVPNAGCFKDYSDYAIPLPITGNPKVFPDNPIHIGRGWETNADHLAHAIETVLSRLDAWKETANAYSQIVKKDYSWEAICDNLFNLLVQYKFCS